jgi:hypothetical protein
MRNGKPKKPLPKWLVDWLARKPPIKSADSEFGVLTTSPEPEEVIQNIDDWLQAHPELARIRKIAKAYEDLRQTALKELEARKR